MTDNQAIRRAARLLGTLLLGIGATALLLPGYAAAQQQRQALDTIVAVVNDGVVLRSELAREIQFVLVTQPQARQMQQRALEQEVLNQLIAQRLQTQRAAQLGIQVPDELLNAAMAQLASQNGIPLEQFPQFIASQGLDYASFREQIRIQLISRAVQERDVLPRITVSEREIEQYLVREQRGRLLQDYEFHVSHILIELPSSSPTPAQLAEAEVRVQEVYRRLDEGQDFGSLALMTSDAGTAEGGGAIGWRRGVDLPSGFDAVVGLQPGDVTEPILTASGFQILRLNDIRGGDPIMVEQVHARHILLSPNEFLDDDAVLRRLASLREQIVDDGDFASIARSVSEDSASAVNGGDLGWIEPRNYSAEFSFQLNTLEVGTVSEPFRTPAGWHVVEVLDRRVHDATTEILRREATNNLIDRKAQEEVNLWLRRLRDEAYVDVRI